MDPLKKAVRFVKNGMSVRLAALKSDISVSSLHRHLKREGVISNAQKNQRYNQTQKEYARNLRHLGFSYEKISKETKVNRTSIISWCSDIAVDVEHAKINLGSLVEKQRLAVELRRCNKLVSEIAEELGCAKSSVSLWLKKHTKLTGEELGSTSVSGRRNKSKVRKRNKKPLGIKIDKKEKAILLRREGKYFSEISKETMCSIGSVSLWVRDYIKETGEDINKKAFERKKNERSEKSGSNHVCLDEVVKKRYQGISIKEIAFKMSVSPYVIKSLLKSHQFTDEDLKKIKEKSLRHEQDRRIKGEIKEIGGARQGSGRAKTGYYKGIYCGSTYELCWVIHSLDHGVDFSRFSGSLKSGKVTYYPDFLLSDQQTIVELKGYEDDCSVKKKTDVAQKHGYKVIVLRKDDLDFAFNYVKEKYGVDQKQSFILYDDFKPTYTYVCSTCKNEFGAEKKKKSDVVFCSRSCAGRAHVSKARNAPSRIKPTEFKSKLSKEEIISIFYADGTYKAIGAQYKIHGAMVGFIKNKKVHKELLKDL